MAEPKRPSLPEVLHQPRATMRVLLIEDEAGLCDALRKLLQENGFSTDVAYDGEEGLFKAQGVDYDVVVLDLMLPRRNGYDVLRTLRETRDVPVLILTARDALEDKVKGLNLGADDYLTKPFELEELIARIRALVRRSANHPSPLLKIGDVELDTLARTVRKAGEPVPLTAKEYAILELLLLHRGQLVTRTMIYDHIYGEEDDTLSNVVDVYVSNLRRKLGPDLIVTRRGEGYIVRV